jgi:hypothetical protein
MHFHGLRAWGVGCASQSLGVETDETLQYEGRRRLLGGAFGRWGEAIRNRPGCRLPDVLLERVGNPPPFDYCTYLLRPSTLGRLSSPKREQPHHHLRLPPARFLHASRPAHSPTHASLIAPPPEAPHSVQRRKNCEESARSQRPHPRAPFRRYERAGLDDCGAVFCCHGCGDGADVVWRHG